eukprot:TRINITY_DN1961_c0_g2_i1.p1 TRINITY_DN1961_c0_g2~~TRINITY_DN1961_c0_g2_i1.p1  ORF type:complete len:846 (+),score=189.61 TRINITY_DN1961_c0_g2_i1:67-2604(+)
MEALALASPASTFCGSWNAHKVCSEHHIAGSLCLGSLRPRTSLSLSLSRKDYVSQSLRSSSIWGRKTCLSLHKIRFQRQPCLVSCSNVDVTTGRLENGKSESSGGRELSGDAASTSYPVTAQSLDINSSNENMQLNSLEGMQERSTDASTSAAPAVKVLDSAAGAEETRESQSAGEEASQEEKDWTLWQAIVNSKIVRMVTQWPSWQQRKKLEQLLADADANPTDPGKQATYLNELNKVNCQAVIERFEKREYASDPHVVVEYLKALVATNAISGYLPDERTGKPSGLSNLMAELKQRSSGDPDDMVVSPGLTEQQPLHVVMVEPKSSDKAMKLVHEIASSVLAMIFFFLIWLIGAAALRKYVNGVAGMGTPGAGGMSASSAYAPKEYSKETLPEKNVKTFKDVKGCDEAKSELEEIVEYLKNPTKFTRLGGKLPKGVLLIGPPGTGKTLLAKAIAGEAGVPFFYRAGSEFEEMFVGVGARRVRSLFQAAKKKAPCIVFIDEIDAVGGSRKQWEGHTKKTLNQLLVEMDGFEANEGIIVLAATNLPETLDPALTRPGRFDRHVVVPNPDVRGRQEILELYLADKPLATDVEVKALARGTPGFSGADLANLVNMAAVKAAVDGTESISSEQLEYAKDKIFMGTERKSMALTDESRRLTAYHESGHAVVALNTRGANPIHKATIMPRGNALGMVTQLPDKDETSVSRLQMMARLDVCMGGRVAEEMVFGPDHVTSGARNDLQQATALARHMVQECGMSETLGPIYIDETHRPSYDIQKRVDAEITRLLKDAYERVTKLLKKHEADLHSLAKALLENETLNAKDIRAILSPQEQPQEEMSAMGQPSNS